MTNEYGFRLSGGRISWSRKPYSSEAQSFGRLSPVSIVPMADLESAKRARALIGNVDPAAAERNHASQGY
jgi:hypothetical protein